jgi:MerR family redox-sensitive transcriptional activator SoxR
MFPAEEPDMAELSIGQVAKRVGVASSAIRFYESEGLLPKADRLGGRRVYPESIVQRLALIHLAKSAGFTIAEIRRLLRGFSRSTPPGVRWRALASGKVSELDERIREAMRMKQVLEAVMDCECPTLDDCARPMCGEGEC